jgi:geranylgeranyl pyrophosphate synthase
MTPKKKLIEQSIAILQQKGQKAVKLARQTVLQEKIGYKPLKEALGYFMEDWNDVLHPALVSLACEAVGGNPDITIQFGAALVLLAGGADVHDDIIDQSVTKGSKKTVFGKFGRDIAILVGDALLLKGTYLLHEAAELLPKNKRKTILTIVRQAFFEISGAEAKEASFRGKTDLSVQEYLEIIRHKVAASEASTMIGAILGNGTEKEIEILGHYGRTFGILFAVRDEFVDVFEKDEITNRAKRECLPLPIIVAFQDNSRKIEIIKLLKGRITADKIEKILDLSMDCKENREQVREMRRMVEQESLKLSTLQYSQSILELVMESTLEDL